MLMDQETGKVLNQIPRGYAQNEGSTHNDIAFNKALSIKKKDGFDNPSKIS